jgi:hypothetical protein
VRLLPCATANLGVPDRNAQKPLLPMSAYPAKKFTKPARSAMQSGATRASFAGPSTPL